MKRGNTRASLTEPDIRAFHVFIYALAEPGTMTVRYVGKSCDPTTRLSGHLSQQAPYRMRAWVQDLALSGNRPRLLILLRVSPGEDAASAERLLIFLHDKGQLLNGRGVRNQKKIDLRNGKDRVLLNKLAKTDNSLRRRLADRDSRAAE